MVMPKGYRKDMEKRKGGLTDEWYESKLSDGRVALLNRTRRRKSEKRRARSNKIKAIEYLGGSCVDCGTMYADVDRIMRIGGVTFAPACAFDIDHVKWQKKTKNFSGIMKRNFERVIKPEIDNCECELVCKNCHVIRTTNMKNNDEEYKKKLRESAKKGWRSQYSSAEEQ